MPSRAGVPTLLTGRMAVVYTYAMQPLADLNRQPRVATDPFYGFTVEERYVVAAHAGRSRRTGTQVHLAVKRTVVAVDPAAPSPMAATFRIGQVLGIEPACYSAKHATETPGRDTDAVTCQRCRRW